MTILSLVIILPFILAIMAIDIPGVQVGANIQPRGYVAGILGMVVTTSLSPTATLSVVANLGTPFQQTTTIGKVGVPLHQTTTLSQTSMVSTAIDLPTNTPQLGTPKAVTVKPTNTSRYIHPLYSSPSFYSQHSVA